MTRSRPLLFAHIAVGTLAVWGACLPFGELVPCDSGDECAADQRCSASGFCVDASVRDGGPGDGGPGDGGAGPRDGGPGDAGGEPDAGGSLDGGPPGPGCVFLPHTAIVGGRDVDPELVDGGRWVCPEPPARTVDDGRPSDAGPFDGPIPELDGGRPLDEDAGRDGRDAGAQPTFPPPEPPPAIDAGTRDGRACVPPDGGLLELTDGGLLVPRFDGGFSCPPAAG